MKISIVHKLAFTSVMLILVSVSVVGGLFYNKTSSLLVENVLEDVASEVRNAGYLLQSIIDTQKNDVLFLASTPPVQGILRTYDNKFDIVDHSTHKQWTQRLEKIFFSQLQRKQSYLNARFIDLNGQELVSVQRVNGLITVAKAKDLQNKAKRNYVKQGLKLAEGSVYISEINLNREFGRVTLPHLEVLRISTPVFNQANGKLAGIIAITAEIGTKLSNIQKRANAKNSSQIYITNDRGGYLLHPDKNKTYSFDLGKRYRIQEDLPHVAKLFLPENKKEQLILLPEHTKGKQVVNFSKIPFDLNNPARFIAVAIVYNVSTIAQKETGVLTEVAAWAVLLTLVAVIITILLSYQLTRPLKNITQAVDDFAHEHETTAILPLEQKDEIGVLARAFDSMMSQVVETQNNLRSINENLELMVAERTRSLKESELQQRAILETINDAIITVDSNGFITSFNPAAETCFGYKSIEILGKNISYLIPDDKKEGHQFYIDNSDIHAERIINISRDVEGQRKDKTLFPMELNVSSMQQDGEYGFVATIRDITERQRIDKMKNEFISTVSHELRTPLTSIRGSLGLISGGAVGVLPEEASHMLKIAANNTERLLLLINDILDIQKIEAGKISLKFNKLAVAPFLEQAIDDNAAYAAQHKVKFIFDKTLSDAYIYADKDRMMQVMANLLSNAAKFSPEHDVVEISVARHDNLIRISVTDHGVGIPDSFHEKLFEKFTQSDSSDTRKKGGTGLGLSITKVIMEAHGGRINFVSREGVGSTFYIELPEVVGEVEPDSFPFRKLANEKHRPCILIVEDDADIAALLRRMLAEAGFNADIAHDAAAARAALKANKCAYNLITLDLMLPGVDGLSFLNELRSKSDTKDIPVVVISAIADEAKRELIGTSMGVIDWLSKPIDQTRLLNAVQQFASKNKIPHVLHVEDEQDVLDVVALMLHGRCELTPAMTISEAKDRLVSETFDLILLDVAFPDGSGLELLPIIHQLPHPPQVIIFSAHDVAPEYAMQVNEVLVKSKTDNFTLIELINKIFAHQ